MEDEYKDISEVADEVKLARKVSLQEMHNAIVNLTKLLNDMLVMFKTASEQMKLEEKEKEQVHNKIMEKLDRLLDENKTIAESLVAIAGMVKEKDTMLKPEFKPELKPEPFPKLQESRPMPPMQPNIPPIQQMPPPNLGMQPAMMPQMQPRYQPQQMYPPPTMPPPSPDFDIPDLDEPFPFEEDKKKKGIFGRLKK